MTFDWNTSKLTFFGEFLCLHGLSDNKFDIASINIKKGDLSLNSLNLILLLDKELKDNKSRFPTKAKSNCESIGKK